MVRRINELIETLTPAPSAASAGDSSAESSGGGAIQVPLAFRWRGRRYVVGSVLAQWVETGAWWTAEAAANSAAANSAAANSAQANSAEAVLPDDAERQLWRVEVCRGTQTGVFDLCLHHGGATHGGANRRWSVFAIHD